MDDIEFNELTVQEIGRICNKDSWDQNDRNTIYYLLGLLAGKLVKENQETES